MRWILLVVVGLVVVGAVAASQKREREQAAVREGATAIDVTADQLLADYQANEVSADRQYRDQVLRVAGAVQAIKKDFSDRPYVVLRTRSEFTGVHARFDGDAGLGAIRVGQRITVRCIGDNVVIGSPQLRRCVLD